MVFIYFILNGLIPVLEDLGVISMVPKTSHSNVNLEIFIEFICNFLQLNKI